MAWRRPSAGRKVQGVAFRHPFTDSIAFPPLSSLNRLQRLFLLLNKGTSKMGSPFLIRLVAPFSLIRLVAPFALICLSRRSRYSASHAVLAILPLTPFTLIRLVATGIRIEKLCLLGSQLAPAIEVQVRGQREAGLLPQISHILGLLFERAPQNCGEDNFTSTRKENLQNVTRALFVAITYDKMCDAWTGQTPTSPCLLRTPKNYNAVIFLHRDDRPYPQRLLFHSEVNQGKRLMNGKCCKTFQPFFMPQDAKKNCEELMNKLMVNFDPFKYLVTDIKALEFRKFCGIRHVEMVLGW